MRKNVLIVFGGRSCEHDISIVSAFQCLKAFDEYLYNIKLVYIDKLGKWRLVKNFDIDNFLKQRESLDIVQLGTNDNVLYIKKGKKYKPLISIDIVFPILHGVNGEDGAIMGQLKMSNIPYVGCNNLTSAIGLDKSIFKKVCSKLPVLPSLEVTADDVGNEEILQKKVSSKVGFPCIIKPSRLGSSIGIQICKNKENLINLLKKSLNFDKKVVFEPYVENLREFNIALYRFENSLVLSEIEEPIVKNEMLSFNDKYLNFTGNFESKNIPPRIGQTLRKQIENVASNCYNLLDCSGVVRVDFIYDKSVKKLYLNEINTIPGSLALYLFEAKGIDKKTVIDQVIHDALRRFLNDNDVKIDYQSNVLEKQDFTKFSRA